MKDRLIIRIDAEQQGVTWGLQTASATNNAEAEFFQERGELLLADVIALSELSAERDVMLLVPASRVSTFAIDAPTKNRNQLEKAVPYILEEQVVEQVEKLHFAVGSVHSNSRVAVNVIEKSYLDTLLALFEEAGIRVTSVVSEAACLPVYEDAWTVLVESDKSHQACDELVLVRENSEEFWYSNNETAAVVMTWKLQQQFEEEQSVVQAVRVFHTKESAETFSGVAGLAIQTVPVADSLQWLVQGYDESSKSAINLLQQSYQVQHENRQSLGAWKAPAIAAGVLLAVALSMLVSQFVVLSQRADIASERIVSLAQQVIPSVTSATSAIGRLDGLINKLGKNSGGTSSSLTQMMNQVFTSIELSKVRVSQIDYQAKRGAFSFDAEAQTYEDLTAIQSSLEKQSLAVDMRNASERDGVWSARISIKVGS